jgi:hypothetical protein
MSPTPLRKKETKKPPSRAKRLSISALQLLRQPIRHLAASSEKSGQNSKYKGRYIELPNVQVWKDFVTVAEIEKLWENNPTMRKAINRPLSIIEERSCAIGDPVFVAFNPNETSSEILWGPVQNKLNLVSHICAQGTQKTDKPELVIMGNGASAQWISPDAEEGAAKKKPDYAGYPFSTRRVKRIDVGAKTRFNKIPGDAKLQRKICRAMLPPNGAKFNPKRKNVEARKVLSQIHAYMDQREARYGYIVTDEELIFLRRRGTGWGHIDITDAIRHDVEPNRDTNTLNSSYVLFYFHWKIANDETSDGWRLQSNARDCDNLNEDPDDEKAALKPTPKSRRAPIAQYKKKQSVIVGARTTRQKICEQLVGAMSWMPSIKSMMAEFQKVADDMPSTIM